MELFEAISGRRSVRKFKDDPVPQELVDQLLTAAQWAPSWAHTQAVEAVVVSRPELKAALQESLPVTNPAYRAMVDAPLVVAICARTGKAGFYKGQAATHWGDWLLFDAGLAMQNFMLAAHGVGLATVCVGLFDAAKAAAALQAPPGVEVVALTPLGYAAAEAKVPPRKPREDFVRWEGYQRT